MKTYFLNQLKKYKSKLSNIWVKICKKLSCVLLTCFFQAIILLEPRTHLNEIGIFSLSSPMSSLVVLLFREPVQAEKRGSLSQDAMARWNACHTGTSSKTLSCFSGIKFSHHSTQNINKYQHSKICIVLKNSFLNKTILFSDTWAVKSWVRLLLTKLHLSAHFCKVTS